MNRGKTIVAFVLGFAAGVIVAEKYFARNYEEIAQNEIESVKESYRAKEHALEKKHDRKEYGSVLEEAGYSQDSYEEVERPYIISPDEYGELDDYNQISLTYYKRDGVLADENDYEIDDVEGTIGKDSLNHFGEYEEDSVFVRNDRRKTDYEILLDLGTWSGFYN